MSDWQGLNLYDSLSGDTPLFLVHKSYRNASRIPELLGHLGSKHGNRLGVGTVLRLPKMTPNTASLFSQSVSHVPVRIVDPELWRLPESGWPGQDTVSKKKAQLWDYLATPPQKVSSLWVKSVLDVQRKYDASVLLSANGWVSSVDGQRALQRSLEWAEESRQQTNGARLWVNLTFDSAWLTEETLRNILIEEIVESNHQDWYLRFWWPEVSPRYGQIRSDAVLEGYKSLALECDLEEKRLYLPNTGMTGWLASAIGAAGFSTGMSWPEQAFAYERPIARMPGSSYNPPVPRLFDGKLLHTMEYSEYQRIRELNRYNELETPFLFEMAERGHTTEIAGLHYLAAVGELTSKLAGRKPHLAATRIVRDAMDIAESFSPAEQLSGNNSPAHLAYWQAILN